MMSKNVSIITYHYVRDFSITGMPKVKGLDVKDFQGQLEYMDKYYNFITTDVLIEALIGGKKILPDRPILLTFDDGLIDHYRFVFPLLKQKRISAAFFPPARAIKERKVLNVHKIHHILERVSDYSVIIEEIQTEINMKKSYFKLDSYDDYYQRHAKQGRFDNKDVVFIKRILQKGLPTIFRDELIESLFNKYVSKDEVDFSYGLYLTTEEIQEMSASGMHIGGHGYNHDWLNVLTDDQLDFEIEQTTNFLSELQVDMTMLTMCYPFGGYDDRVVNKLRKLGYQAGFTVNQGIANIASYNPYLLPRIDTNYLPMFPDSEMSQWTKQVI